MNRHVLGLSSLTAALVACGSTDSPPRITLGLGTPLAQAAPGEIHLRADVQSAADLRGVTFYQGSRVVGTDRAAPYEMTDYLSASGQYAYRAVATDVNGRQADSGLTVTIDIPTGLGSLGGTVAEFVGFDASGVQTRTWSGGAGTATLTAGGTQVTAPLAADGTFAFTLPALPSGAALGPLTAGSLGLSCASAPTFNVPGAQAAVAALTVTAGQSGRALPVTQSYAAVNGVPRSWNLAVGGLLYVDRPVTVTGTAACTYGALAGQATFNVTLLRGWNKVTTNLVHDGKTFTAQVAGGSLPTNTWVYGLPALP